MKKDLDDLKAGRLDKIAERQELDPVARKVSIVIIKIINKDWTVNPMKWYYDIVWNNNYDTVPCFKTYTNLVNSLNTASNYLTVGSTPYFTGTMIQNNIGGTYKTKDGKIISL